MEANVTEDEARIKRLKGMTNDEFVSHLMNYSPYGGVVQAFIIEAIAYYAEEVVNSEGTLEDASKLISMDTWKGVAKDVLTKIKEKYNREPTNG